MQNLGQIATIDQVYLTGNPCSNWSKYREFVVGMVPQLRELDGKEITHSERLEALQVIENLRQELRRDAEMNVKTKAENGTEDDKGYTKEARIQMARESERLRQEKEQESMQKENEYYGMCYSGIKPVEPPSVLNTKGEIRQCNQGNYPFEFYEKNIKEVQYIVLEVGVPKYMETSLIDVDLHPAYVRIDIKGKITQLRFPCEIVVERSKVTRSQTTGSLQITMPKLQKTLVPYYFTKEELNQNKLNEAASSSTSQPAPLKSIQPQELILSHPTAISRPVPAQEIESDEDLPPLEEI